jgi:hypothetical protein
MVNPLSQNRFKSSVLVYGLSPFDQNAVWSTMLLIKREINYIALQIRRVNIWFLSPKTTIYGSNYVSDTLCNTVATLPNRTNWYHIGYILKVMTTSILFGLCGVLLQKTYIIWLSNLLTLRVLDEKIITETCRVQISTFVFAFDTLWLLRTILYYISYICNWTNDSCGGLDCGWPIVDKST